MKIALDAMGGDFGPAVVVEGAVVAAREHGIASVLVGDKAAIEREILHSSRDPGRGHGGGPLAGAAPQA